MKTKIFIALCGFVLGLLLLIAGLLFSSLTLTIAGVLSILVVGLLKLSKNRLETKVRLTKT